MVFSKYTDQRKKCASVSLMVLSAMLASCSQSTVLEASSPIGQTEKNGNFYHVAKTGSDESEGSLDAPFLNINTAAQIAKAGDTIIVHEGIYREWVQPLNGGTSEDNRVIYKAADGEDVRIYGSEHVDGWVQQKSGVWKLELEETFFGDFNPFNTLSRHPENVVADEEGDGWGWLKYGRWTHLGDVIVNGRGLTEKQSLREVEATELTWSTATKDGITTIYANFGGLDPNPANVEINARPYAFFPKGVGRNYITFEGFKVMNVASSWAPPTVHQPGAVGPNGGHHWNIKNNIIMYAKGLCVSLGVPSNHVQQSVPPIREPNELGHHIVEGNVLMRCGQGGVAGQSFVDNSVVANNHIEDINYREEFGGWETAGIKHHVTSNLRVTNNFVRNVHTIDPEIGAAHGIWNDFRNTDWVIDGNIVTGAEANSLLMEANWPGVSNMVSNNIFAGGEFAFYSTTGDVLAHNLILESKHKWENQKWQDRPRLSDTQFLNNVFVGEGLDPEVDADDYKYSHNVFLGGAEKHPEDLKAVSGAADTRWKLNERGSGVVLSMDVDQSLTQIEVPIVRTADLGGHFTINVDVTKDKFGEIRQDLKNAAGPFASLSAGRSELEVYKYSSLYLEALALIGEKSE